MSQQIVVIGAGIGGLAAALRLAHAGERVTVCEAHSAPGGKMRTLPSAAGPVDAGPTVMTMRHVFEGLFADVGERLDNHVTLHRETVLARHFWHDGTTLDLFADPERSAEAVRSFAGPKAERQFRTFSKQAQSLYEAFDAPMMQSAAPQMGALSAAALKRSALAKLLMSGRTLAQELSRAFEDPRLRQLFGRYATYVGGSPFQSPALLSLIWHAEALGVWRVDGGMHALAQAVARLAETRGAEFHYNAPVAEIETDRGRVSGVRLENGTRLPADKVLFNGDPRAISTGRLGTRVSKAVATKAVEPRSLSAEVWAFAAAPRGPELAHHNVFFGGDPRDEFDPIAKGRLPKDPTLYICAQDRGTGITPDHGSLERFEIIMNAPPCADPNGQARNEETPPCRTTVFETLKAFGLSFSPEPDIQTATGPQGFNRLFPASLGSLYGRSPHGLTASLDKPRVVTKVPGLYLAGGGVHPGAGIPMATLSGRHAAAAMLKDRGSTSTSTPTAMPGGTSTGSRTMEPALSRSSLS
ncbi:MAG: 1-hydroxycarotenoid 3,4-desaturase CrtD [Pseudomonadota bacterium]